MHFLSLFCLPEAAKSLNDVKIQLKTMFVMRFPVVGVAMVFRMVAMAGKRLVQSPARCYVNFWFQGNFMTAALAGQCRSGLLKDLV